MRLFAFQGLRYDSSDLRPGELAAPPYDQIDEAQRDELHAISPHHFTHLTRPVATDDLDAYSHADQLHEQWLEQRVVTREEEPAIYPYEIEFPDGARRLGVTALIGLEPPDSEEIRPHERTLDKPLADRLKLLETMRVDLEPALFLSDDAGALDDLIRGDIETAEPLAVHRDASGHLHRLFRVTDAKRFPLYKEALGRRFGAIADGHHRYKVAQKLAESHEPAEGTAAAAKLAVVTSLTSPALTIDPIHRGLETTPDLSALEEVAVARNPWEPGPTGEHTGAAFAGAVARASQPALGVLLPDGTAEIWRLDPHQAPDDVSAGAAKLPVVLLHEVVLSKLGLSKESWTDGSVSYRSDPDRLYSQVNNGELGVGFFLPGMDPESFREAIAEGDLLPPKSTRFLPKVVSGLVWADHDSELA